MGRKGLNKSGETVISQSDGDEVKRSISIQTDPLVNLSIKSKTTQTKWLPIVTEKKTVSTQTTIEDYWEFEVDVDESKGDIILETKHDLGSFSAIPTAPDQDYEMSQSETESECESVNEEIPAINEKETVLSNDKPHCKQLKLIVFEEAIFNAFQYCFKCGSKCRVFTKNRVGSLCSICVSCSMDSKHNFSWSTGPILNHLPVFHLLIASSVLCCGMEASKVLRLFHSLNIPCIKRRELSNLLTAYAIPAVVTVWKKEQENHLDNVRGQSIVIASDMRVDSPGHSGLLGSGSSLDLTRNVILDTQIVKVTHFKIVIKYICLLSTFSSTMNYFKKGGSFSCITDLLNRYFLIMVCCSTEY